MADKLGSDAKTERLLNLVLALLGSSRYIKKSELLSVIPGYEGSPETRERMFERDKEELRGIGIPIDVEQIDPLFEDEHGYRINNESYQIQIPQITSSEALLISAALETFSLENVSKRTQSLLDLMKIKKEENGKTLPSRLRTYMPSISASSVELIYLAIHQKNQISFQYQSEIGGSFSNREISPYGIGARNRSWYLVGYDHFKEGLRTFNLLQILAVNKLEKELKPPSPNFSLHDEINSHKQHSLEIVFSIPQSLTTFFELEGAVLIDTDDDKSVMKIYHDQPISLFKILISQSNQFEIISPIEIQKQFIAFLSWLKND